MEKNWRPKGWKNPELASSDPLHSCQKPDFCSCDKYDAFEAGADAMLEALRKMGKDSLHSVDANNDIGFRLIKCKQVYIPNEG